MIEYLYTSLDMIENLVYHVEQRVNEVNTQCMYTFEDLVGTAEIFLYTNLLLRYHYLIWISIAKNKNHLSFLLH